MHLSDSKDTNRDWEEKSCFRSIGTSLFGKHLLLVLVATQPVISYFADFQKSFVVFSIQAHPLFILTNANLVKAQFGS